jgi:glycosyltransferase involved in cell wall biosynthesis
MKILVFPADQAGCGFYRLTWPAQALRARGLDVDPLDPKAEILMRTGRDRQGRKIAVIHEMPEADVVVLQRCMDWRWPFAVAQMREAGIRVIIDIDDDLHAMRSDHGAYLQFNPINNPDVNWENMRIAAEQASLVTATTQPILDRYANGTQGLVIPNCIPQWVLELPRPEPHDEVVIGWPGQTYSHPGDLDTIQGIIPRVERATGATFTVFGQSKGVRKALGLRAEPPWIRQVPIDQYHRMLMAFDVGIAPLMRNTFNAAKSWLKVLEFAAVGIPSIGSETPEYLRAREAGLCETATNPEEWDRLLRRICTDRDLREECGRGARLNAAHWTIEGNIWRWQQAWTGVSDSRQVLEPVL